jgi:hypothetical protein
MSTVPTLPPAPSTSDPANFDTLGDAFVAALPDWGDAINLVADEVNTDASNTASNAASAAASSAAASASASMANFKGDWSSLTGAYTVPTIVLYGGLYWSLTTNTASIQSITPGVSALWVPASPFAVPGVDDPLKSPRMADLGKMAFVDIPMHRPVVEIKSSAYTVTSADAGKILVVSGTTTITLPAASGAYNASEPFAIGIKAQTGATVTVARTGSDTIETVAGNKSMTANTGLWFYPSSTAAWETI